MSDYVSCCWGLPKSPQHGQERHLNLLWSHPIGQNHHSGLLRAIDAFKVWLKFSWEPTQCSKVLLTPAYEPMENSREDVQRNSSKKLSEETCA